MIHKTGLFFLGCTFSSAILCECVPGELAYIVNICNQCNGKLFRRDLLPGKELTTGSKNYLYSISSEPCDTVYLVA